MTETSTTAKILIVEDEVITQKMVSIALVRAGYQTMFASNGVEALERIMEEPPDLILSDVMMPEMDGFTLLYAVRGNPETNHIPVILLTARNSGDDIIDGLDMGADDYIPKPFEIDNLLASIKERLARVKPVS